MDRASKDIIKELLETIATYNTTPEEGKGCTRLVFTKEELAAKDYVISKMKEIGMSVSIDAIGNIFGCYEGTNPDLAPVWTGSHIDTVLNAGIFDGMAGIVCGLEAVRLMYNAQIKPKRSIYVNIYTSEEPTRFGLSCLGSRALSGHLKLEGTKELYDCDGNSLYEVLKEVGCISDDFDKMVKKPGDVYASLELHIEQNGILEKNKKSIGVVRGICAPTVYEVSITGIQSHAGGTSMADRRDAFMAASEIALLLENLAKTSKSEYITGTIGKCDIFPGTVNVIPGEVKFTIDIRSISMEDKEELIAILIKEIDSIAKKRDVIVKVEEMNHDRPIICGEKLMEKIEKHCDEYEIEHMRLISGPYHDSLFIGEFAPIAMIFVPSKNGISHSPDEWTDYEELAVGADVLAKTLLEIANE